jgi:hypothetical protein
MKTTTLLKTSIAFSILLILNSCGKNINQPVLTGSPDVYEVEYKVSPLNESFISLSYTDSAGNKITTYDIDDFVKGSKKINVKGRPFDAILSAKVRNESGEDMGFNLTISVNGEVQEYADFQEPSRWPNFGVTDSLEYKVQ